MFKKPISLLCAILLSTSFVAGSNVSAAVVLPDAPAYSYTSNCNSQLTITGSTAECYSYVTGYYGSTTKIVIKQILQKKTSSGNWEDVCSWNSTINNFKGSVTNYKYSLSSGTYRLKSVFTVYAGSNYETITKYGY